MKPAPNHPITDLDARFSAVHPDETYQVMEALRAAGIYFDVTVNGPKDEPEAQSYDIFWFQKEDDMKRIGEVLKATVSK
jgi:hypothetical protein